MKAFLFAMLFSATAFAQGAIPIGTVLPLELRSSLNSEKDKSGQTILAHVRQDVVLSPGSKIHAGAKVTGKIVGVEAAKNGQPAQITFRFDSVEIGHRPFAIKTSLRALASPMDVEDAQIPSTGLDRGTPWAWATRNLIGGEVAYGQGGPVARGTDVVGEALANGVVAPVTASRELGCRGEVAGNDRPQALWVFSSNACGLYGFSHVRIAHAGRTAPEGEIRLTAGNGKIEIGSGSAVLLRVIEGGTN